MFAKKAGKRNSVVVTYATTSQRNLTVKIQFDDEIKMPYYYTRKMRERRKKEGRERKGKRQQLTTEAMDKNVSEEKLESGERGKGTVTAASTTLTKAEHC